MTNQLTKIYIKITQCQVNKHEHYPTQELNPVPTTDRQGSYQLGYANRVTQLASYQNPKYTQMSLLSGIEVFI